MKELSIVIPILNEAKNINQLIPEINKGLDFILVSNIEQPLLSKPTA